MRGCQGGGPLEILCLNGDGLDHELNTCVTHVTYVHQCLAVEVWWHGNVIPEEQVVGGLNIEVEGTVNASVQEAIVNTDVPLMSNLPLQVGVGVLTHFKGLNPLAVHRQHITISGKVVDILSQIRRAWCDTCNTVTHTEAQVVEPAASALHELLVHDVPAERERGEGSPLVIFTKLGRTLMTEADESVVLIGIAIADTSEETHKLIVVSVAAHRGVVFLVCQERTVAEVVPQECCRREVCVAGSETVIDIIEIAVTHDAVETVITPLGIIA